MTWVFGYGSLVFRPGFPFERREPAVLRGWTRRFWQGSPDHRGVPGAPGRVATLVRDEAASVWGMAYRVAAEHVDEVLDRLDHREREGYERHLLALHGPDGDRLVEEALVYVATHANPHWLGDAPLEAIAEHVLRCEGPSGPNDAYVLELARALRAIGAHDAHVFKLAALVERGRRGGSSRG